MREEKWAELVTDKIHSYLKTINTNYAADVRQKLNYANDIVQYNCDIPEYKESKFETDILIYEYVGKDSWKPRVVIETKVYSVDTHDAITYSKKAQNHRFIHPYLRYGIFLGNMGNIGVPARVLRHGENFDFMHAWKEHEPSETEWNTLCEILASEIEASQIIEKSLFNNKGKNKEKYFSYHKRLVVET